jgi:hypothetical protein
MINESALEERLAKLESAKSWSPRVMSRLETLIRSGPDEAVFRINPIRFASERASRSYPCAFSRARRMRLAKGRRVSDLPP